MVRAFFLELAEALDGEPVMPDWADHFFATMRDPIEAAIEGLKQPVTDQRAARLAISLLDAKARLVN